MINKWLKSASFYWHGINDWKTDRKIVVIESDDWGSVRMPNKKTYEKLCADGYKLWLAPFEKFDTIASDKDFDKLFTLLTSFKDSNGRHPVFTANTITGNPDFLKIKKENFYEYYFESFKETIENYGRSCIETWFEGINTGVFYPQFHGREHVNVFTWMDKLRDKKSDEFKVIDYRMAGVPHKNDIKIGNYHQVALNVDTKKNKVRNFVEQSLKDGIDIFLNTFNYTPITFIAPAYTWDRSIEKILKKNSVSAFQGGRYQRVPCSRKQVKHFTSEKKNGITYLVRNAFFEPSTTLRYENRNAFVDDLKNKTELAFKFKKPLIISSHRINYVGTIFEKNRDVNLDLLRRYLKWLLIKFPEVEFLTTVELLNHINNENSYTPIKLGL